MCENITKLLISSGKELLRERRPLYRKIARFRSVSNNKPVKKANGIDCYLHRIEKIGSRIREIFSNPNKKPF
jgi:hypothetical protein